MVLVPTWYCTNQTTLPPKVTLPHQRGTKFKFRVSSKGEPDLHKLVAWALIAGIIWEATMLLGWWEIGADENGTDRQPGARGRVA